MPTSPNSGSLGIRIVDIHPEVQKIPNSRIYIVDRLLPNSIVSKRIEVTNSSNSSLRVSLYPGAATNNGGSFLASPAGVGNALTTWTTISPTEATIAPHGHLFAEVTISTPGGAQAGEQYGVIWASVNMPTTPDGIINVRRVGIRMADPVGRQIIKTTTSTHKGIMGVHLNIADFQSILIGLLFICVLALMAKEIKRQRRKLKKRSKSRHR